MSDPGDGPDLSVVIPVYRAGGTLGELVERLTAVLGRLGRTHEVVLVEDGSPDDSWEVVRQLRARYPDRVVGIQLMRNYGQHNALMCGFRHARGRLVVTMDDDLQHPPEEVPKLLAALDGSDHDLVYGTYERKRHPIWRNAGSALLNVFFRRVFGLPIGLTGFRAVRRPLVEAILRHSHCNVFVDGLFAWNTTRVGHVVLEHAPRRRGRSGYSMGKLAVLALHLVTNSSLLPLQLVSGLGVAAAMGGVGLGLYYAVRNLVYGLAVPASASTIVAILMLEAYSCSPSGSSASTWAACI